jgi:hypothetical protein
MSHRNSRYDILKNIHDQKEPNLSLARKIHSKLVMIKNSCRSWIPKKINSTDFSNLESRREIISQKLANQLNFKVKYGPFKGLLLNSDFNWSKSDIAPMLLGTYEQPILEYIAKTSTNIRNFINIGAGDGYYAVGMLYANFSERAFAYEISEKSRQSILGNAISNDVKNRINIKGAVTNNFLSEYSEKELEESLILVDIEGAEFELFESLDVNKLIRTRIIIELHDFIEYSEHKVARLVSQFIESHSISIIKTGPRNLDEMPELENMHDSDRWLMISEGRPKLMKWLCLEPLHANSVN